MTSASLVALAEPAPVDAISERRREYRCDCGHVFRVFGDGRHRVYFEPANARLDDPVMTRTCPDCGRGLPGKSAPVTADITPTRTLPEGGS
ncbi:MAG: hypothetical protein ABSH51_20400 [Solirubrobacteraceae bacterium]|jgi:hypothetical protein